MLNCISETVITSFWENITPVLTPDKGRPAPSTTRPLSSGIENQAPNINVSWPPKSQYTAGKCMSYNICCWLASLCVKDALIHV